MSTDGTNSDTPDGDDPNNNDPISTENSGTRLVEMPIEDELKESYLTYAMSVIVSRALPDVRDGLKPSQRRILVAMNDLNLSPGASRVKCAKISGDTSGNYHPHGESVIYPTLVRMAQEWNMRCVLVDKQGNFGSIAGLPPAAMRYTEARMSHFAGLLLEDLKLDTVDYTPTYDERGTEPTVLPSKYPNLLVNGTNGIAVGMATSIPPHNLGEVCSAVIRLIEEPTVSIESLMEIIPGPDFPTGGIICGRSGVRRGYLTGRSTIQVRSHTTIEEYKKGRWRILIHDLPYQQTRDRVEEKIASLVTDGRVAGISALRNESDLKEPVRLIVEIKRDADPEVVLNQLYQFSPIQDSFSMIMLALVDGQPRTLTLKDMLQEYIRHRVTVIRRRTQFLLAKARQRKHTIEGLLLALADIDEIIRVIRASATQAEAKISLMGIECPASMMARALGEEGFALFVDERGESDTYSLTAVQTDAILRMTLGQLVGLEQDKLGAEHHKLLLEITDYLRILSDEQNILDIIKEQMEEISKRFGDKRRTEISLEELGNIDLEDLIEEEDMVVSISHNGYIKRTPTSVYKAQKRGGKGVKGAKSEDEDPIEHLFVASTHAYLLFFTNQGKVHWQKVYDLPNLSRDARGRAIVNLLQLEDGERIADCRAVRDFNLPGHFLVMATKKGLIKKTKLEAYSRPMKRGIIAIKLREGDELVDVVVTKPDDELVLSTSNGMAIRFRDDDARPVGRNSSGVKGVNLSANDVLVGMVVADPDAQLLTVCENGYGKRTNFGPGTSSEETEEETASGTARYRTQRRGGKGVRDIKTTARNGKVVGIARVTDEDEVLMMTSGGKLQRIAASDISIVGRNTQGVRIMSLGKGDTLAAAVRVPKDEENEEEATVETAADGPNSDAPSSDTADSATSETDSSETPESPENTDSDNTPSED